MADFDTAVKVLLEDEGGLVEDPRDPGGATKYGISLKFYKENVNPKADKTDIENLTVADAKRIYLKFFWASKRYNSIASQKIATKVFDIAVNIGPQHATKCLQLATQKVSEMKIEADGILGGRSLFAINLAPEDKLYAQFKEEIANYYHDLVFVHPNLQPFLHGWLNRCNRDV